MVSRLSFLELSKQSSGGGNKQVYDTVLLFAVVDAKLTRTLFFRTFVAQEAVWLP